MLLVKLIEPPCTEPYARWCERSKFLRKQKFLLLDFKKIPQPPGLARDRNNGMIGQRRWLRLAAKIKGGRKIQ